MYDLKVMVKSNLTMFPWMQLLPWAMYEEYISLFENNVTTYSVDNSNGNIYPPKGKPRKGKGMSCL